MRSTLPRGSSLIKASPLSDQSPNPCDLFRRLVEARNRRDAAAGRRLVVELRALGWSIFPCSPKPARGER